MVVKILLLPLWILKWVLLVLVSAFLGMLFSIALDFAQAQRVVEFVPVLAKVSEQVPVFLCGALGGLILGKLAFGVFRKKNMEL